MRILSSALLFLGLLVVYARGETCPEPEEMEPCECEEDEETGQIIVSCVNEPDTLGELKQALNGLSEKKDVVIELDGLDLGRVPSDFFSGIGVKTLDISHCELASLSDDDSRPPLLGLEDSLEELVIMSSFSEDEVPAKLQLGHLQKLKELDLSFNTITELSDDWFERGPASLQILAISNNGIEKIGDRAFANLVNLKELSLDGNRFGPLKRSMLPNPANRLATLELDNNDLTSIPEDLFSGMPALHHVSLRTNRISRLEQRTWEPIWQQLDLLYLEGNPLQCDSHMDWMFNLRTDAGVMGRCETPSEREGQHLKDFINSRG